MSGAVELAARRRGPPSGPRAEAETMSALAGAEPRRSELAARGPRACRETFGMESVALEGPATGRRGEWLDVEHVGWAPPGEEAPLRFDVPVGHDLRLVGRGPALFAEDQRVLRGASRRPPRTAYEGRRLSGEAARGPRARRGRPAAHRAARRRRPRPAHAARRDQGGGRAACARPTSSGPTSERDELLATIEESADRLDDVVANLLDASRLEAGALSVAARSRSRWTRSSRAAAARAAGRLASGVASTWPRTCRSCTPTPGLLERVVANLIDNALRHGRRQGRSRSSPTAGETTREARR